MLSFSLATVAPAFRRSGSVLCSQRSPASERMDGCCSAEEDAGDGDVVSVLVERVKDV